MPNLARTFILRSLRFHARSHVGTMLGVAVATAVLVGALAVGDSMRESLRELNLQRIGQTDFVLAGKDRLFRAQLANDISDKDVPVLVRAAPVLMLPGTASNPDASARANHVQVLGVGERFWSFAPAPTGLKFDGVLVNDALAEQLRLKAGDPIVLRVHKPSLVSGEAPMSPRDQTSISLRVPVAGVVHGDKFGAFSLQANQTTPLNVFVPLATLQAAIETPSSANLLLVHARHATTQGVTARLQDAWKLADAQLSITNVAGQAELRSDRVFIDSPVVETVLKTVTNAQLVSTYFVNELRHGTNSTPYSMVTGIGEPIVPREMADNEIVINQWLAEDLHTEAGDELQLEYLVLGESQKLEEKHDIFRVRKVVPMEGAAADRSLMPNFPGIAKAEKTENWDAGFAIDMKKIRPKDEDYWKKFRGTPKAFVTLNAAKKMWGNRFGDYTAIRFPTNEVAAVTTALAQNLRPAQLGLTFEPIRQRVLNAASQGQDFGELFFAFSFFLIVAALILMALLFQFGLEQRATETGTLLAVGWRAQTVRRFVLLEALVIAVVGAVLGVIGGLLYANGILYGLRTIWRGAVGTSALQFHVSVLTVFIGLVSSIVLAVLVIWFVLRRQSKKASRELLERGSENEIAVVDQKRGWSKWIAIVCLVAAIGMTGAAMAQKQSSAAETFFGSGALLLIAGLAGTMVWLRRLGAVTHSNGLDVRSFAVRATARRRKRSLATIALLACGTFLIVAVEANKLSAISETGRSSGTGGFALIGESSLPIVQDLNSKAGRDFFNLDALQMQGVTVVPMRVRDGDDASCLNLNRPQTPRILGVNSQTLAQLRAFTFTGAIKGAQPSWDLLKPQGDEVPAVADANSLEWSLHKSVGDVLDYTDQRGHSFKIRIVGAIANSILQGNLIIDESAFIKHFPDETGYRMFLIDAPSNKAEAVAAALSRGLEDRGLEVTSAAKRLDEFNTVQNTYLNTFQILGGLGLLLGTVGLGVVVLRNVLERRAELALFSAVGLRPPVLRKLVVMEHGALLLAGLVIGVVAAMVAIVPALRGPVQQVNYRGLSITLAVICLSGLVWTWMAAWIALRGELLKALRNE
jgi:putative ABC transport system permease protein